jgi:predicted nucleic acid-binding protein
MPSVYLDVCCLNRPFDDQTQTRIRLEAEAVLIILAQCEAGRWQWFGSKVVNAEIERTPDPERRRRVQTLAAHAHGLISVSDLQIERAHELEALGFDAYDALHLACAESGKVDVFVTTDDGLLRRAATLSKLLRVQVVNPLAWLEENQ